jgi:hypothetical protein
MYTAENSQCAELGDDPCHPKGNFLLGTQEEVHAICVVLFSGTVSITRSQTMVLEGHLLLYSL